MTQNNTNKTQLYFPNLSFKEISKTTSSTWSLFKKSDEVYISLIQNNNLYVSCSFTENRFDYFTSEEGNFDIPPVNLDICKISPDTSYEILINVNKITKVPDIQCWVIEYSHKKRLTHTNIILSEGLNKLSFISSSETTCFKIAFRLSGIGTFSIQPIEIFQKKKLIN